MSSLKRVGISFLLVLGWMWIYRLPDGSALAEVKDETCSPPIPLAPIPRGEGSVRGFFF